MKIINKCLNRNKCRHMYWMNACIFDFVMKKHFSFYPNIEFLLDFYHFPRILTISLNIHVNVCILFCYWKTSLFLWALETLNLYSSLFACRKSKCAINSISPSARWYPNLIMKHFMYTFTFRTHFLWMNITKIKINMHDVINSTFNIARD